MGFSAWRNAIEAIFEVLLTAIWEILLQLTGEFLLEVGFHAAGESFRRRSRAHPVFAGTGLVILGAIAGLITSLLVPARVLPPSPLPGVSLFLSPALTGLLMEAYGRWRDRRGRPRSYAATFWGGALFAFSMALVRFVLVGH
jgi:hypothetical protein